MGDLKQPEFVPDPKNQPSPEQAQNVFIRPGSGLAVIGTYLEIVRGRFSTDAGLQWVWNPDPKAGSIVIESAFNEEKLDRNNRPAIYIDRDDLVTGRTVLGDVASRHIPSGKVAFWALRTMPLLIECVAAKKAESAIIADLVDVFLQASSDLIQAKFGFHDMQPTTLGRTQPFPRDKTQWVTSLTFSVQYNFRWTNAPTVALLNAIEAKVCASGFEDATSFFEEIVLGEP